MNQPTLASLAAELKVSRQTVSNVLNFPDRVRPETRARVLEAIERSGYRPSAAARALRNQRAMALGLRLSQRRNGISGTIVDGFMHALVGLADRRATASWCSRRRATTRRLPSSSTCAAASRSTRASSPTPGSGTSARPGSPPRGAVRVLRQAVGRP
ncbi:LacI family transcriptional regulator [Tessaracoccus sp. HDW20]|uniref:LacI family DNA-binding transcriptional regulator n=1 Tax=Tessaracoccus coleopterorum TaxID=2714950 RepID=UPI0018D348F0|nr:LacI family transcriptional regulator [Tessaracoccus coleopterorum]